MPRCWNYITSKLFAEGSAVAQNRCSAVAQNRCSAVAQNRCSAVAQNRCSAVAQNGCSAVAQNRCSAEMYTDCAMVHIAGALYMYTEVQYRELPTAGLTVNDLQLV